MPERIDDIIAFRKQKLQDLLAAGIDPYPSTTGRDTTISDALERFDSLAETATHITLAGRIRSMRIQGKVGFMDIEDPSGRMQLFFKADDLGDAYTQLDLYDLGDFIEATGVLFRTKTEAKTLDVKMFKILAKSLRPLPSEFYGLENQELRLRKRYVDMIMNPEVRDMFRKKSVFWAAIQQFLVDAEFLQVEAPVLEAVPGGAEAEPFVTHHNALDRDFYLRISLELPLKKMIVGGFEKVFEIGRVFRNEGIDTEHLQDYTAMEFYWAYADFQTMISFVQRMYQFVIQKTFGTLQTEYQGTTIDWSGSWPMLDYFELFKRYTDIDLHTATESELRTYATAQGIRFEEFAGMGRLIDLIFKKKIRILPEVSMQPAFLVNQPVAIEPLAKRVPGNTHAVQRMQILACGSELGKGFGELNDPLDQRARFEDQMRLRERGDGEAQMINEDYLEAMEYGMPPLAGFGMAERLFAVLMDKSIRETVVFPPMKQTQEQQDKE